MLTLPLLVAPRFITAGVQIAKKVRASIGKRQNYSSLQLVIEDADGILPKYFGLGGMTCAAAAGLALLPDDNADVAPARNLFRAALERLPSVKSAEGSILTDGFLDLCRLTLPLIGQ
ncbi:hypothetical protein MNEG_14925 [Monoraphidium neglectum]|uniref:Uncharacterized protein n=1 Tax=Monoraphidium neglectum TaxID=145388 RepID=A0A0D2KAI9_9CHLO|nr:hypothetical protein MNEG_14925 [Monoraphidium neglectum]KIY93038.1 hypothetical protein MNEG_14925 [Monoraphidium neglectum]|eukprot:XP_013892058.1 hypothetical protein MNEG_14925 [Monoraphidium neglectum]